jgi:hypothetical protein
LDIIDDGPAEVGEARALSLEMETGPGRDSLKQEGTCEGVESVEKGGLVSEAVVLERG